MEKTNLRNPAGIFLLLLAISFSSCWSTFEKDVDNGGVYYNTIRDEAYVPVYGTDSVIREIKRIDARATINPGKIYVYGNLLFQVEKLRGVHVIDFSDRHNPVKLGFITCEGSTEVAVKNGFLLTNNLNDLVSIDYRDSTNVREVARVVNAFPQYLIEMYQSLQPPAKGKYYVCPQWNKGDVIGWKLEKNVSGANCFSN